MLQLWIAQWGILVFSNLGTLHVKDLCHYYICTMHFYVCICVIQSNVLIIATSIPYLPTKEIKVPLIGGGLFPAPHDQVFRHKARRGSPIQTPSNRLPIKRYNHPLDMGISQDELLQIQVLLSVQQDSQLPSLHGIDKVIGEPYRHLITYSKPITDGVIYSYLHIFLQNYQHSVFR